MLHARTGKCAKEIEQLCKDVEVGNARLADCLAEQTLQLETEAGADSRVRTPTPRPWVGCGSRGSRISQGHRDQARGRGGGGCRLSRPSVLHGWTGGVRRLEPCLAPQSMTQTDFAGWLQMSQECRDEILQYKIDRNSNINKNVPLGGC